MRRLHGIWQKHVPGRATAQEAGHRHALPAATPIRAIGTCALMDERYDYKAERQRK